MIFHTAADNTYYNNFYNLYSLTIRQFYPNSKFSLYFLGNQLPNNSTISYLNQENISFEDIEQKYNTTGRDTKGYYALSRWKSMPVVNENVVVSDIDLIALKSIPQEIINNIFKNHEAINISRLKKNGDEGCMAMMILRKDIIDIVNNFANNILDTETLHWASDVSVRNFIYKNFSVYTLPEMHVFKKRSNYNTLDSTNRSFGIFKGPIDQKIYSLTKAKK